MTHDPGGKVRLRLSGDMSASAEFSPCGRYRHTLWRTWSPLREESPFMMVLAMNPSTADATHDDPTVRRMIRLAQREGFESLCVCNVMDYRATNPSALVRDEVEPRSPSNLPAISRNASIAERVVVAFGALPPPLTRFAREATDMLMGQGVRLWCLGTTASGMPRHPLYVRSDAPLVAWEGRP